MHEQNVAAAGFRSTDTFVERVGDGITSLNTIAPNPNTGAIGSAVYVDEMSPTGTLYQSIVLPTADSQAFSISAVTESGTIISATTLAPNDFAVGQIVTITGIPTSGYDGDVTITSVIGNTFTYTGGASLAAPGTLTAATAQGVVHAVVGDGHQSTDGQLSLSGMDSRCGSPVTTTSAAVRDRCRCRPQPAPPACRVRSR